MDDKAVELGKGLTIRELVSMLNKFGDEIGFEKEVVFEAVAPYCNGEQGYMMPTIYTSVDLHPPKINETKKLKVAVIVDRVLVNDRMIIHSTKDDLSFTGGHHLVDGYDRFEKFYFEPSGNWDEDVNKLNKLGYVKLGNNGEVGQVWIRPDISLLKDD